jgi:DNA-binding response OmpR family regulator
MKVLIVDDDRTLVDLLAFTMRRAGFEPLLAFDAGQAMKVFKESSVDVVLLDVNMPGEVGLRDGFDVCREIREISNVPIILLTVRDDEEDVIKGLTIGADDYILKPFSPRQLVARVKTVLRRATSGKIASTEPYQFEDCRFNPGTREFDRTGCDPVLLTRLESQLLDTLMLNQGQMIPAEILIDHVWGVEGGSTEMLRQLVHRLRQKIEVDPANPKLIKNLPGVGYGFAVK